MQPLLPSGSFIGNTTRTQVGRAFRFVETSIAPGTVVSPHAHESTSVYLFVEGACNEQYRHKSRFSQRGSVVFHPATHSHSGVWQQQVGKCFNVEITQESLVYIQGYAALPEDAVHLPAGVASQICLRIYREFIQPDTVSPLAMEGMMFELIASICRYVNIAKDAIPPRWLQNVVELLDNRYCENLTLAQIAATVDVHASHLARVFRQHLHCSVGEDVRRRRMDHICSQLKVSELSIGEIAIGAGYHDQSHFTKTFKRVQGTTPAEYRRQFRKCTDYTYK